jgi:hypothetical protein
MQIVERELTQMKESNKDVTSHSVPKKKTPSWQA